MAFDTKPNLSDNKFEQFAGETLSLSGCTDIYGEIEVKPSGSFILADGSEGLNKIMGSDISGKGTWKNSTELGLITGGTNGLTVSGGDLRLGGDLSLTTTDIDLNGNCFQITNASPLMSFLMRGTNGSISFQSPNTLWLLDTGYTCFQNTILSNSSKLSLQGNGYGVLSSSVSLTLCGGSALSIKSDSTTFTDDNNNGGVKYTADYSGTYTDRSLVDKAYVVSCAGSSGIQSANNGLTKSGTNVVLGGLLTGDTTICGGVSEHCLYLGANGANCKLGHLFAYAAQCVALSADVNVELTPTCVFHTGTGSKYMQIVCDGAWTINDGLTSAGMVYGNNYSAVSGANPRWIPDAAWVTGQTPSVSASGENVTKEVSQSSHGFAVKDFVGWSGGTYNKAIADGNYDGEFVGLVTEVPDSNTFKLTQSGYITGLTGVVANTTYFLSEGTAGLITSTEPTGDGEISRAVLIANSTTSGWVFPYPGFVISSGATVISTANNGLTDNGGIVQLGGALCQTTTISGLDSYDLQITGNWMKYTADYSAGIGPRDIPDAEWVTGNTGIGNVNWDGTTANGIGTYVDADTICSEPNLTFNIVSGEPTLTISAATVNRALLNYCAGSSLLKLGFVDGTPDQFSLWDSADNVLFNVYPTTGTELFYNAAKKLETVTGGATVTGIACATTCLKAPIVQLTTGAADGCVLTSNAAGCGVWCTPSGGASYWSGDTNGISNSGLTNVGIGVQSNADYGLAVYNAGRYGMSLTNCLNSTYSPTIACASGLLLNNEYNGATDQQNFTNIYLQAHGGTGGGQNYHATISAVHAASANHTGFLAIQGRNQAGTAEMMRLCNAVAGVEVYINGNTCQSKNIYFCQGASRTICVAQATDGGAGDQLYICAGGADDIGTSTCYVGGGLYLYGGRGSNETASGSQGGTGGVNKVVGGAGGSSQYCYCGGTGGNAYLCGGSGGLGCCDTGLIGDVCVSGYDANLCGTNNVCVHGVNTFICGTSVRLYGGTAVYLYDGAALKLNTISTGVCVTGCGLATDWIASSDCRLKKCVEPISNALSMVNELCGVCYDFCEDGTPDMGLIAQDVEKILPRLVSHNEPSDIEREKYCINDETLGLKYNKLSGLFVEAIKDLTEQNKCLQKQIMTLRDEMREINE